MPRSAGGTYTLPQAAFVAGTVIQSTLVNSDLSDIATALTQSLATTGVSTMTGPIKAASGSVTAPGVTFASSTGTGFYLISSDTIGWAAAGVLAATFASAGTVTWGFGATWTGTITATGVVATSTMTLGGAPVTAFDVATAGMFVQTAAPTGWTKSVTHNDKALRVVSGAASSGGSVAFSTLFARTATDAYTLLSPADIPSHLHSSGGTNSSKVVQSGSGISVVDNSGSPNTGSTGAGGAHSHNIDMRVQYVDVIIATKN